MSIIKSYEQDHSDGCTMPDVLGLDDLWIWLVLGDDLHDPLLVVLGGEHLIEPVVALLLVEKVDELVGGEGLRLGEALEQLLNVSPQGELYFKCLYLIK